jgi:hypothetical protein
LVTAFEDDAVEFVVCDCYWEIGLCFPAGGEAREKFGIEKRNPGCLRWGSPVEKCEERSCGVVDTGVLME